ncbi:MAG: shikimate kinase [Candidatus Eremiobacteraeota bacterium]|nr:shikimate kinase [Candidatus Eremiobacteraeota bacterium]MBV8204344.1 shikimate kinase [Candidatus Eremiobacteraeota bacterium]MBV8263193.1 shikimate kinase [Candidatus Eremiobacteraeota bacterium]MBV8461504.1 shikimate kinase [Candidatus Eremiobacteraeota bacterium]MBV8596000.1 shikimate kinase [Candidatus Eremiobacteraeota bacterium]
MNVALTGFMGAGKSTTGKRLARLLGMPFIDADAELERLHGSIAEIFATRGEREFRRLETEMIERLSADGPRVIAVGGGAVVELSNRRMLRRHGVIVHLKVSPAVAWRRVAHRRHRPLLGERPDLARVTSMLTERASAYADCDYVVHVDHRTPLGTARAIARWYRARQPHAADPA